MRQFSFEIPIYRWQLKVILIDGKEDLDKATKLAAALHFPDKDDFLSQIKNKSFDGGKTYTNRSARVVVMVVFPQSSGNSLVNTVNHEKRHIIDDILEWHEIKDKEAAGYLDGYVAEELYKRFKKLRATKK